MPVFFSQVVSTNKQMIVSLYNFIRHLRQLLPVCSGLVQMVEGKRGGEQLWGRMY